MKAPRSRAEDDLNAFLDAAAAGRTGTPVAIDPALALTVGHVHGLPGTSPDPALKRQVWSTLMARSAPAPSLSLMLSHTIAATRLEAEFTPPALPRHRRRFDREHAVRRDWGSFATAAFLLLFVGAILGGVFMLGRPHTDGSAQLPAGLAATSGSGSLYIGHFARLTADIPSNWTVDPTRTFDYVGPNGFVVSEPIIGEALKDACTAMAVSQRFDAEAAITATTWSSDDACHVAGQIHGEAAVALVVPHPHPFELWSERYAFAALITKPDDLDAIASTLDFSPDRVIPEAYAVSLLDLVQARSYWAEAVDWPTVRQQVLDFVDGLETVEMARQGILSLITTNLRLVGDTHSLVRLASDSYSLAEASGFGALVGGQQVLLVYPNSPADRSGVRAGDLVESVDGLPMSPVPQPVDLGTIASSDLTLRRPGVPEPITVTIERADYSRYAPPTGRRLSNDIGYIALPAVTIPGQNAAYAAAGDDILTTLDAAPNCGWVVDLRLDFGGSYSPMVTSVGPILGNGTFVGWQYRDGRRSWVAYDNGRITDDGYEVSNYLGEQAHKLHIPNPAVAVLTGPMTASAGEVAALAFVGRPGTRLFGQTTSGLTTANQSYPLFDGTILALSTSQMIDRTGAPHPEGIVPDEIIATDWTTYGTDADPVLTAAEAWLAQQPSCAAAREN